MRAYLGEDTSPSAFRYAVRYEGHTNLAPYDEEYGEDFWEAYRDGYAAGWFTRYDIIESPLYAENIEEKGGAADDAAKTELL